MKIKSIERVGKQNVYDITVEGEHHYILQNGVVSHNTGIMYAANTAFIVSKSQEKDGDELAGWNFTLNTEKSRFVKQKQKFPYTVLYKGGIQKFSGIFELALETGFIKTEKQGWYLTYDPKTKEMDPKAKRKSAILENEEYMTYLCQDESFKKAVESRYKLANGGSDANDDVAHDEFFDDILDN